MPRSRPAAWQPNYGEDMFVKICGITNEDDALLAVAMGADAVGFVFAPSPRQIAMPKVRDIVSRLPPEILTVGVFRDEHPARVVEVARSAGVRAVQLHGHESPAVVREVMDHVRMVIKGVVAGSVDAGRADIFGTRYILVDAPAPGSGRVFDWNLAADIPAGIDVLLAGGLTPDNVAAGIEQVRPWGVDVSSGVESAPGRKDPILLRRFVENARAAAEGGHQLMSGDSEARRPPRPAPYDWQDD